ncbi:MAG: serine/threonine-protein phosphatase [Ignavibacteriales bacterium]|nr:serine/threonine-protein phosphatase [Ignavibacteriales bacterium]
MILRKMIQLVLYTDGVTEAKNEDLEDFGDTEFSEDSSVQIYAKCGRTLQTRL